MPRSAPRWSSVRPALAALERWLLPGECLLCHAPAGADHADPLICAPCRGRWQSLPEPQCSRCGQPLVQGIDCRLCAAWPAGLSGIRSAVWLDQPARRAVHLLKYQGWWRVSEPMALAMRRLPLGAAHTLIPIPLGPARLRSRGYNQSAVLARALGKLCGAQVAEEVLLRRRDTATQTALTPEARAANLAGAFVAEGAPPPDPVLVDDVFTTGATLAEAAGALLAAGAVRVTAVTFARATRPLAEAATVFGSPA